MTDFTFPKQLGRYLILRELGRGAMGVVYEGRDPQIGRRVAIKTARRELTAGVGANPDALERFFREARVAGMLNHPNIITVHDAGEQDGTAFIAMEYIEGPDLRARIEKGPPFTPEEAVELAVVLADALAFAHKQGVVHRDVKPANIMLPRNGPPKLADFGIAHVLDSTLTQEGALLGTPSYMSPEQFMGQRVDGRSDLFSLAIVLYELLTGERPFPGAAFSTVMHHVIKTDPVRPQELNFAIGERLGKVVMKALNKAPHDRYRDGHAFAEALRSAVKAESVPVPVSGLQDATVQMNASSFLSVSPANSAQSAPLSVNTSVSAPSDSPNLTEYFPPPENTKEGNGTGAKLRPTTSSRLAGIVLPLLVAGAGLIIYHQLSRQTVMPVAVMEQPNTVLDTPGDPAEDYRLRVNVYATADLRESLAYRKLANEQGDTASHIADAVASGRIQPLRGAGYSVVVFDPLHPSEPFSTESLTEDGYALIQIPRNIPKINFEVRLGAVLLLPVELPAFACQNSQNFVVLCPNCLPGGSNRPAPLTP
jgi:serine/threonine protein kinase